MTVGMAVATTVASMAAMNMDASKAATVSGRLVVEPTRRSVLLNARAGGAPAFAETPSKCRCPEQASSGDSGGGAPARRSRGAPAGMPRAAARPRARCVRRRVLGAQLLEPIEHPAVRRTDQGGAAVHGGEVEDVLVVAPRRRPDGAQGAAPAGRRRRGAPAGCPSQARRGAWRAWCAGRRRARCAGRGRPDPGHLGRRAPTAPPARTRRAVRLETLPRGCASGCDGATTAIIRTGPRARRSSPGAMPSGVTTPTVEVPASTRAVTADMSCMSTRRSTAGKVRAKSRQSWTSAASGKSWSTHSETVASTPPASSCACCRRASTSAHTRRAATSSALPCAVGAGILPERSQSGTPSACSRLAMAVLTADCTRASLRPAAEKLPCSMTVSQVRS